MFIPVAAFHADERYFNDPKRFDPDRFNNSADKNRSNRPYLPFGIGPRNCIGMRLGKMQTKVGIVTMLQKYRFELSAAMKDHEMPLDPKSFLIAPRDLIQLKVFKR